jgi:hypothetical protein
MRNLRLVRQPAAIDLALPPLDPEVQAMLEHVRIIAPIPKAVRARALARARSTLGRSRVTRGCP